MKDNNSSASSLTTKKMDLWYRHIKLLTESISRYVMASDNPIGMIRVSQTILAL